MKNIEWFKREIRKELESWQGVEGGIDGDGINEITLLINQLDEPEVTLDRAFEKVAESYLMTKEEIWRHLEWLEARGSKVTYKETEVLSQKLPVIPKFVAEVIEEHKEIGDDVYDSINTIIETNGEGLPSISKWVARNIDKYARAWLDGYEVADEPHYYVAFEGGFNLLYVTHIDIYGENGKFNYNSESNKNHAIKFTDKIKAKYLADFLGAIVVEVTQ